MEEWARIGRKNNDRCQSEGPGIGRSRSANNILVRGFQLLKQKPSMRRSSSRERSIEEVSCELKGYGLLNKKKNEK
jgi:hypothetical protein